MGGGGKNCILLSSLQLSDTLRFKMQRLLGRRATLKPVASPVLKVFGKESPIEFSLLLLTERSRVVRLAGLYFAIIFATGFVLGTLRVIFLVPMLGPRYAELLEIPLMLAAVFLVGGWIGRLANNHKQALSVGFMALLLLLAAEIGLAAILFQKTPIEALFDKDLVSGTAYYLALLVFALMPAWLHKK